MGMGSASASARMKFLRDKRWVLLSVGHWEGRWVDQSALLRGRVEMLALV